MFKKGSSPNEPQQAYLQKHAQHSQAVLSRHSFLVVRVSHRIPVNQMQLEHRGRIHTALDAASRSAAAPPPVRPVCAPLMILMILINLGRPAGLWPNVQQTTESRGSAFPVGLGGRGEKGGPL